MDTYTPQFRLQFRLRDRDWELDPDLYIDESIALQKVTGRTYAELCVGMDTGDAEAVKAFFWLARVRAGENIAYDGEEMRFRWSEFAWRRVDPAEPTPAAEPEPEPVVVRRDQLLPPTPA